MSVLSGEETGVPGENHRPAANHWQTLSHKIALGTPRNEQDSNSQLLCPTNHEGYHVSLNKFLHSSPLKGIVLISPSRLGLSWSWSTQGSWIFNYMCCQCLLPLKLTVWISLLARCTRVDTTLCDKVCPWLVTGRWFSLGIRFPPPIKLPRYKWNIVESGIKHHNPNSI